MNEEILQENENKEEPPKVIETSILFEKYAIWVMIPFLLVAIWYSFTPLIVVSTFLLLITLIIKVWKNMSLNHVKPSLELSKSRLFVEQEFQVKGSIYNDKWLPLIWLDWIFPSYKGIILGDEAQTHSIRFLWLLWFQEVKWTLKGRAYKRGVYDLGKITLCSGDGFRFSEIEKSYNLNKIIYVYPKIVPVSISKFKPSIRWGVNGKKGGFIEDPLLVTSIREYQAGDEMRKLNWKVSARTGKLQTNVYQPVVIQELMLYIDVEGFILNKEMYRDDQELKEHLHKKRQDFEALLSIIASLTVKFNEQGIGVGFSSNGLNYLGEKMTDIAPSRNMIPLLDELAKADQAVESEKMKTINELMHRENLHLPLLVFCYHITKNHYIWHQKYRHKLSEVYFYYKEDTEYSNLLADNAKSIDALLF